jgi:hypothetical protein
MNVFNDPVRFTELSVSPEGPIGSSIPKFGWYSAVPEIYIVYNL